VLGVPKVRLHSPKKRVSALLQISFLDSVDSDLFTESETADFSVLHRCGAIKGARRQVQGGALAPPWILLFSVLQNTIHVQSLTQRQFSTE